MVAVTISRVKGADYGLHDITGLSSLLPQLLDGQTNIAQMTHGECEMQGERHNCILRWAQLAAWRQS